MIFYAKSAICGGLGRTKCDTGNVTEKWEATRWSSQAIYIEKYATRKTNEAEHYRYQERKN